MFIWEIRLFPLIFCLNFGTSADFLTAFYHWNVLGYFTMVQYHRTCSRGVFWVLLKTFRTLWKS